MKKLKKMFVVIASLFAVVVSSATFGAQSFSVANASEESGSLSSNLLSENENSGEGDYHRYPTDEQLNIMLTSGEYFNIHYELLELYLLEDTRGLEKFAERTHWRFKNVVDDGMNNKSCGKRHDDYDSIIITTLVEAAIAANNKGIKYEISLYAHEIPNINEVLILRYELMCLPAFMIGVYFAIKKTQESAECPEILRDFDIYPVNFFEAKQPESSPAKVPYYWIIVAGVGGVAVTALAFILVDLKKKKKVASDK